MKRFLWLVALFEGSLLWSMHVTRPKLGVNPLYFKGTHSIVQPAYAPVWGMLMLDKDISKQWYMLSGVRVGKEAKNGVSHLLDSMPEDQKALILKVLSEQKNTGMQKLINQFFDIAGGTFSVTNARSNPVCQFTPKIIGKTLRLLHDGISSSNTAEIIVNGTIRPYWVSLGLIKPADPKDKESKARLFKSADFKEISTAFIDALGECVGAESMYPEGTVQAVWLSYLVAKSGSRQDLQEYFRGFKGDDSFQLPDEKFTKKELLEISGSSPDLAQFNSFADFVCSVVFFQKYSSSALPPMAVQSKIKYNNYEFTTCVDSMMVNLINIASYSDIDEKFGKAPDGIVLSQELKSFYDKPYCLDSSDVNCVETVGAWIEMLENRVGIAYNRAAALGGTDVLIATDCDGFIPVDHFDESLPTKNFEINGTSYQLVEKRVGPKVYFLVPRDLGLICFEVMPEISNIIVMMNDFFQLNLYVSIDEIFELGFAQKHFETMCAKVGWKVVGGISGVKAWADDKEGHIKLDIMLVSGESFAISLMKKAHGAISVVQKSKFKASSSIVETFEKSTGLIQYAGVSLGILNSDEIIREAIDFVSVININDRFEIIKKILKVEKSKFEVSSLSTLILSMTSTQDDYFIKEIIRILGFSVKALPVKIFDSLRFLVITSGFSDPVKHMFFSNKSLKELITVDHSASEQIDLLIDLSREYLDSSIINDFAANRVKDFIYRDMISSEQVNKLMQFFDFVSPSDHWIDVLSLLVSHNLISAVELEKTFKFMQGCVKKSNIHLDEEIVRLFRELINKKIISSQQVNEVLEIIEIGIRKSEHELGVQYSHNVSWIDILVLLIDGHLIGANNLEKVFQLLKIGFVNRDYIYELSLCVNALIQNKLLLNVSQIDFLLDLFSMHHPDPKRSSAVSSLNTLRKKYVIYDMASKAKSKISSMLRFNPQAKNPEATFMTEAKRQYTQGMQKALRQIEQDEALIDLGLMVREREMFERRGHQQLQRFEAEPVGQASVLATPLPQLPVAKHAITPSMPSRISPSTVAAAVSKSGARSLRRIGR